MATIIYVFLEEKIRGIEGFREERKDHNGVINYYLGERELYRDMEQFHIDISDFNDPILVAVKDIVEKVHLRDWLLSASEEVCGRHSHESAIALVQMRSQAGKPKVPFCRITGKLEDVKKLHNKILKGEIGIKN